MAAQTGVLHLKLITRRKVMDNVSQALLMASGGTTAAPSGQIAYTTVGTYTFVVPAGVTSISAVCVGAGTNGTGFGYGGGNGGGLAWANAIPVTAGQSITVTVGAAGTSSGFTISPYGSLLGQSRFNTSGSGSFYQTPTGVGTTGGGNGGGGGGSNFGGGGAGGYTGAGGTGGNQYSGGTNGSGGGGGGGGYIGPNSSYYSGDFEYIEQVGAGGGGGVGILGQGSNGTGASVPATGGSGGSGGGSGSSTSSINGASGGLYGGGGGMFGYSAVYNWVTDEDVYYGPGAAGVGAGGAVRIIWGAGRSFPSTNTGNV